ncbi:MAG: replication initiation protein [Veillonellaceae bacterium]|nr:replication initiation protein [Veillonellaceae bacterium]
MENKLIRDKYNKVNIYQAKPLIEACKEFDINEGRLFYLGLLELRPQLSEGSGQQEFDRITIPTSDVIKLFGGNKAYYQRLKNIAGTLQSRLVTVKEDEETFHRINIFREMQFDKKKGGLSIRFNEDMRPYILELAGKPYTKIAAKTIFALSSVYAIRLLELLLEYQNIPRFQQNGRIERNITIEDLRFYCNVGPSKYCKNSDFTRNIVKRPVEEINNATSYKVSFSCRKVGRSIVSYDFVMELPAVMPDGKESIEQIIESTEIAKMEKASRNISGSGMYGELIRHGIGKIVARRLVEGYSEMRIRRNIEYTMSLDKVRNKAAYLRRAIEEDYAATKPLQQDIFAKTNEKDNRAEDLAALKKLGFGDAVSRNFISVVKSGNKFGLTERNLCNEANISAIALFDALKSHDFSTFNTLEYTTAGEDNEVRTVSEPALSDAEPIQEAAVSCQEAEEMKELTRLMQMQLKLKLPEDLQKRLDELSAKHLGV